MAIKIAKKDDARLDALAKALDQSPLNAAVEKYNSAVQAARGELEDALAAYNAAREDAKGFVDDLHSQLEGEYNDMSERWQEGERGQEAKAFVDAVEEVKDKLDEEAKLEFPDDLTLDDAAEDLAALLNEMPREPQS